MLNHGSRPSAQQRKRLFWQHRQRVDELDAEGADRAGPGVPTLTPKGVFFANR
jgi:hypothetical protein